MSPRRKGMVRRARRQRRRLLRWFVAAELGALVVLLASSPHDLRAVLTGGGPTTVTFTYTGGAQTFTVPPGVTSLLVDAQGAEGGGGPGSQGLGGDATATLAVVPGDVLQVVVGGRGQIGGGGFNGGGSAGVAGPPAMAPGGGGGASDVRTGACAATMACGLGARVLVAGGGGGGGADTSGLFGGANGGSGGGATGGAGTDPGGLGIAGSGGSQASGGGAGGTGTTGSLGQGGAGGAAAGFGASGGGGGGGGYYGGGGGGGGSAVPAGGDGGGGSGTGPGGVVLTPGVNASDGVVSIAYTAAGVATTTAITSSTPPGPAAFGEAVTFTATVVPVPAGGAVQFQVDASDVGAPVVVDGSGQATSAPISNLMVGVHSIVAVYGGDPSDLPSTSGGAPFAVGPASTTVTVGVAPNPANVGQAATYQAHVTVDAPGGGVATGSVGFTDDGIGVGGCAAVALDGSADAACVITEGVSGPRTIQAF